MQIDHTPTEPILKVAWAVLFLGYVAWFTYRFRDRQRPRKIPPLVRFGGPWTLFSRRFWETEDVYLRKGSKRYFVGGVLVFAALYLLLGLGS